MFLFPHPVLSTPSQIKTLTFHFTLPSLPVSNARASSHLIESPPKKVQSLSSSFTTLLNSWGHSTLVVSKLQLMNAPFTLPSSSHSLFSLFSLLALALSIRTSMLYRSVYLLSLHTCTPLPILSTIFFFSFLVIVRIPGGRLVGLVSASGTNSSTAKVTQFLSLSHRKF